MFIFVYGCIVSIISLSQTKQLHLHFSSSVAEIIPHCEDDLLLHFPYEDHYNDVTCHHAIATQYGDGVSLQYDAERQGNVACFTGETHFEVNVIYKCLFAFAPIQYDKCNVVSTSVLILVTNLETAIFS